MSSKSQVMNRDDLDPINPEQAVELYLDNRRTDVSEKTLQNHRYRLDRFLEWCESEDITNLNRLTGRDLHTFRSWRSKEIAKVTLVNELRTLQKFLEFAAAIEAVPEGMREQVMIPTLTPDEESDDTELKPERAMEILDHLKRFSYASRDHVTLALLWHGGIRLGTLRAIDVNDIDFTQQCIYLRHRPESDTPLKNGVAAERALSISEKYCRVLEDYIQYNRHDVQDDHGREPLITSQYGRLTAKPIRKTVYQLTQPCILRECPHDKDPESCEYRDWDQVRGCPSSVSPHAIRRGSITHHLRSGMPQRIVEERCNVSSDVLEKHYDERNEVEKMEARREWLSDAFEGGEI